MTTETIASAFRTAARYLRENPGKGAGTDTFARASLEDGLRCRIVGPTGQSATTDMPKGIGGDASAPSPGWLMRAGIASCTATMIALRAADHGITLDRLEVVVESDSDDRGMIGTDDSVPPGPLQARMSIRLSAKGVDKSKLQSIVDWGVVHSPIADALQRAVPMEVVMTVE